MGAAAVAAFSKLAGRLSTRLNQPKSMQDHLWNIQPPRPSLSESQLQSHPVQGNLTVRPEVPLFYAFHWLNHNTSNVMLYSFIHVLLLSCIIIMSLL